MPVQERGRAAAQDRIHERVQAKLERVNVMEDRRNALLQHLAALRRDISDLDAGIRVSVILLRSGQFS